MDTNRSVLEWLSDLVLSRFGQPPLTSRALMSVAGPGCVGKSTLARALVHTLRHRYSYDCEWVDLDGYLIEKDKRESVSPIISGYDPRAFELELAKIDLSGWLQTGTPFHLRIYDKITSQRHRTRLISARDFLVVEGACAFYRPLRDLSRLAIFVDADKDTQYTNRWRREKYLLKKSDAEIREKFGHLFPDYEEHILPTAATADLTLRTEDGYKLSLGSPASMPKKLAVLSHS